MFSKKKEKTCFEFQIVKTTSTVDIFGNFEFSKIRLKFCQHPAMLVFKIQICDFHFCFEKVQVRNLTTYLTIVCTYILQDFFF